MINIFTEPVIHDENLKGYKRNYCKIGVVILAGGVVCAVFLNLCNVKLGNAVFMGIISAEFLYGIDLLINGMHIAKLNGRICGAKRSHSVFEQPNCYQSV